MKYATLALLLASVSASNRRVRMVKAAVLDDEDYSTFNPAQYMHEKYAYYDDEELGSSQDSDEDFSDDDSSDDNSSDESDYSDDSSDDDYYGEDSDDFSDEDSDES